MPNSKDVEMLAREVAGIKEMLETLKKECEEEVRKIVSACLLLSLSAHAFFLFKLCNYPWRASLSASVVMFCLIMIIRKSKVSEQVFPTARMHQEGHPIGSRMKEPALGEDRGTSPLVASHHPTS